MRVLIPNATSPTNIGDLAMLESLIDLIKANIPNSKITIHSVDPKLYQKYEKFRGYTVRNTLYGWSVFENFSPIVRSIRLLELFIGTVQLALRPSAEPITISRVLHDLLQDYQKADIVAFVGGGYFRPKQGIKQGLNLLMNLSAFFLASLGKNQTIVSPISFGPFGYEWEEKLTAGLLSKMDLVAVREEISWEIIKKHNLKNVILSCDHALLRKAHISGKREEILGFTIRSWLKGEKQRNFEAAVAGTMTAFYKKTGWPVLPIVQVSAASYGEDDEEVTDRIIKTLRDTKVIVLPKEKIQSLNQADRIYGQIGLLLGMRMHSNIIAATQNTPFVAIGYEHKTLGIAKQLGVGNYCIDSISVTQKNLTELLFAAYKNRDLIRRLLRKSLTQLMRSEMTVWSKILYDAAANDTGIAKTEVSSILKNLIIQKDVIAKI